MIRMLRNILHFWKEVLNLKLLLEYLTFLILHFQQLQGTVLVNIKFHDYVEILFETDGIDETKLSNQEYLNSLNDGNNQIIFPIYIQLRECEVGEAFSTSGK